MCEIEYEEIDNKEKLCEELKDLFIDNKIESISINKEINLNMKDKNLLEIKHDKDLNVISNIENDCLLLGTKDKDIKIGNKYKSMETMGMCNDINIPNPENDNTQIDISNLNPKFEKKDIILEHDVNESAKKLSLELNKIIDSSECEIIEKNTNETPGNNDNFEKENRTPKRLSELYSQFSSSWKERLKANSFKTQNFSTMCSATKDSNSSEVDISDTESITDIPLIDSQKSVCANSSSNSSSGDIRVEIIQKSRNTVVASCCCGSDSEINTDEKNFASNFESTPEIISTIIKPIVKNAVVTSFGCSFDSDDISVNNTKLSSRKPVCVESGCNSTGDEISIYPISKSNGSIFPKMATSSTATDTENNVNSQTAISAQIDETYNSLEAKILPFVKNPHTIELRLKGRLSVFQRACVKQIATEHKLVIKHFGKGKDGFVMLRKKVEMVTAQKLFLEMKRNEIERKKEKIVQDKVKRERLLNPPMKVSSGCQVDFPDPKEEPQEISKNAARKNRKKQWEFKQKQAAKRNSSSQTVADGFYLCPYCEGDIPESSQSIHYPFCLSKYRAQMQSAAFKSGDSKQKSIVTRSKRPISGERKNRSKSRDKIQHSTIDTIKKKLENIHDNDINSMVNVLNELSKRCTVTGCNRKKQKTCEECMVGYCNEHFSPEFVADSSAHFNCPVAQERIETEKQKRLGTNNPLMKTIEELKTPKFADGVLLKKPKRVRVVNVVPTNEAPVANGEITVTHTGQITQQLNINETRTRIGPMLNFERNQLHKKLRDKIGGLSDRRTK